MKYFFAGLAVAVAVSPVSARADTRPLDPKDWLAQVVQASRGQNFSGIYVRQSGDRVETLRIARVVDGGVEHEKLVSLDGPLLERIRRNDETFCYVPQARTVLMDKRRVPKSFPNLIVGTPQQVLESYRVVFGETERISGTECRWATLEPKDRLRYKQRLCTDVAGFVVRSVLFDEHSQVLEQFTFTQYALGGPMSRDAVRSSFEGKEREWSVDDSGVRATRSGETGWSVAAPPLGFRKLVETKRLVKPNEPAAVHLMYSDGLATVSLFIEPRSGAAPKQVGGVTRDGPISALMSEAHNHRVTVLGEVPGATLNEFFGQLVYRAP